MPTFRHDAMSVLAATLSAFVVASFHRTERECREVGSFGVLGTKVHFFCFAGGASEYVCERRERSRGDHTSYKPQLCLLKQVKWLHSGPRVSACHDRFRARRCPYTTGSVVGQRHGAYSQDGRGACTQLHHRRGHRCDGKDPARCSTGLSPTLRSIPRSGNKMFPPQIQR